MRRRARRRPLIKYAVMALLFGGLFLQICLLAEISGTAKERSETEADIRELSAKCDNLELELAQYRNIGYIGDRAKALKMRLPENDQLRVISLPSEYTQASAHTAELADAE